MGTVRARELPQSDVVRLETEMNTLWGELNTSNIRHYTRVELEKNLADCEEQFNAVLEGKASMEQLEKKLQEMDRALAKEVIRQGESEIPKGERAEKSRLALEHIQREFEEGHITPTRARHEVKEISRMRVF